MVEAAITYQLKTVSTLGGRVYPVVGEKGCAIPFATYLQTGEERKMSLSGPVGITEADYTVNILSTSYTESKEIKALAQAALESMAGNTIEGVPIRKIVIRRETAEFWDPNLNLYGKQLNFTITY